jgi:NAD(P)-dependent dehydrogenase (short-subunit alcohol dehydrogenase family)
MALGLRLAAISVKPEPDSKPMKKRQDLFSLDGRTALVTGGSRGIGRMIAAGLLQQGAEVTISSRKADDCEAAAAELSALGPCHSLPADISTVAGAQRLAEQFGQRHEALSILVHNAGAAWSAPFESFPESGWDKVSDLNLKTPFFLTQAFYPLLRQAAQRQCAKVIHIASIDGLTVNPWETYSYAASKAGLIHLTKRMALRLITDNIVVSCIAPGAFATDMNRQARDHAQEAAARVPAGRIGQADDIAAAAVYLASAAGDYVVGATLTVDGGWSLTRQ